MALRPTVTSLDDVAEHFRELYTERNGQFELTGIEGMKTQADIDRIQTSLTKERDEHKATKSKLANFDGLDPEEVHSKLDRIGELEAAAADKIDDTKINEMVESRLNAKTAPLQRELDKASKTIEEQASELDTFRSKERQRAIHDAVREAATGSKVIDTAMEDVMLLAERVFDVSEDGTILTKDNVGVTPGVDPAVWLTDMQAKRPHWWPASQGSGAGGSGPGGANSGSNPFSRAGWNMTEQGKLVIQDRARAEQLAKAAGTVIGGAKPQAPAS